MTRLAFDTWKIGFSLVQLGLEKDFQESFSKGVDDIQQGQPCVESFSNTALCNPSGQSLD